MNNNLRGTGRTTTQMGMMFRHVVENPNMCVVYYSACNSSCRYNFDYFTKLIKGYYSMYDAIDTVLKSQNKIVFKNGSIITFDSTRKPQDENRPSNKYAGQRNTFIHDHSVYENYIEDIKNNFVNEMGRFRNGDWRGML